MLFLPSPAILCRAQTWNRRGRENVCLRARENAGTKRVKLQTSSGPHRRGHGHPATSPYLFIIANYTRRRLWKCRGECGDCFPISVLAHAPLGCPPLHKPQPPPTRTTTRAPTSTARSSKVPQAPGRSPPCMSVLSYRPLQLAQRARNAGATIIRRTWQCALGSLQCSQDGHRSLSPMRGLPRAHGSQLPREYPPPPPRSLAKSLLPSSR
jgi:hypothetical protein